MSIHRDIIQTYIDLWENASASGSQDASAPPQLPHYSPVAPVETVPEVPRKSARRISRNDTSKARLEGNSGKGIVLQVVRDQWTASPTVHEIKTALDSWSGSSCTAQQTPTEAVEILRSPEMYTTLPPRDLHDASFGSTQEYEDSSGGQTPKPWLQRRGDVSASTADTMPFTPDELWNFHRPQPSAARITVLQGHQSFGRSGDYCSVQTTDRAPQISDTILSSSDFDYDRYVPYPTSSPVTPPARLESPIPRHVSHKPRGSIISIDGKALSIKAAKTLGIDPSATLLLYNPPPLGTDLPDRYNFHRSRSASAPQSISAPQPRTTSSTPPPVLPTLAFPQIQYDGTLDATRVWRSMKGKKLDTELLAATLLSISHDPHTKLPRCKQRYRELYSEDLTVDIRAKTSGHYRLALLRLIAGPHEAEAQALKRNESTYFMDDKLVAEALFGKNPDDIKQIKHHFRVLHGISLHKALRNLYLTNTHSTGTIFDTAGPSAVFGRACIGVLKADREVESVQTLAMMDGDRLMEREQRLMADVEELYQEDPHYAGSKRILKLDMLLDLVTRRSELYLAELCRRFQEKHGKQLAELAQPKDKARMTIGSYYPISLGYAVDYVLRGATNKPQRDAKLLEDCMKGLGTNDSRLVARLIRMHYDPDPRHMHFIKEAYQQQYGRRLCERIRKDTKGDYRDLLLKITEGRSDIATEAL